MVFEWVEILKRVETIGNYSHLTSAYYQTILITEIKFCIDRKLIGRFDVQRAYTRRFACKQRDWGGSFIRVSLKVIFHLNRESSSPIAKYKLPAFVSIPRVSIATVHQSWSIIEIGSNTGWPLAVWKTVETRRFATVGGCRHRTSKPKTPDPASPGSRGWKSHCPTPGRSLCPRGYALTRRWRA